LGYYVVVKTSILEHIEIASKISFLLNFRSWAILSVNHKAKETAKAVSFALAEPKRTRGTRSVPGEAGDRRRGRGKGARRSAAVERREDDSSSEAYFGHRKRGCGATSSPSFPKRGAAFCAPIKLPARS